MFVYRFLDKNENVIYIGKTNNLERRIDDHKNNGHLSEQAYGEVEAIEYLEFTNEIDQYIAEIYFIGKYQPKHNTVYKDKGELTIEADIDENWQLYMHKGEYMNALKEKIDEVKKELKEKQKELKEIKKLINKRDALIEDLEKLEWNKVLKVDNPYLAETGPGSLSKVEDLEDGWWISNIYNDIRGSKVVVIKEDGEITTIYVGDQKYEDRLAKYGTLGEEGAGGRIQFLMECTKIQGLWLNWSNADKALVPKTNRKKEKIIDGTGNRG